MDSERNSSRISSTKNKQIRESKPNRQNVPARKRSLNASYTKQTGTLGTANEPIELDGDPPTHSPVGLYSEPYTYLSTIGWLHRDEQPIIVKVKAYVATMLSRLEHNGGSHWSLAVKINDGSAAVDVDISDQVLTQLIGFSAAECQRMRPLSRTDAKIKQRMRQGIEDCQKTLTDLSCIMELEVGPNSPKHVLRQLYPLKRDNVLKLQERYK